MRETAKEKKRKILRGERMWEKVREQRCNRKKREERDSNRKENLRERKWEDR